MSYDTIINPTVQEAGYYMGSNTEACGTCEDRYFWRNVTLSKGFVTSWRGVKDVTKERSFERYQQNWTGERSLWYCNNGVGASGSQLGVDGGTNWLLCAIEHKTHPAWLNPPDIYDGTLEFHADDIGYQKLMMAKLHAKANAPRFGSATFFAELGESIYYIKDLFIMFFKHSQFLKHALPRAKNPERVWLEWRYAVQPLILTIQDVLAAIEPPTPKEKVQVYKDWGDTRVYNTHKFVYSHGTLVVRSRKTTRFRVGGALTILRQNDPSPWGTGALDVASAGWEIVRASFIFDWFINVGLWLASWRDTNIEAGERYLTKVKNVQIDYWVDGSASDCVRQMITCPTKKDPLTIRSHHIVRFIGDDVAPPTLPVIVPGKQTLLHQLDALALVTALLKTVANRR